MNDGDATRRRTALWLTAKYAAGLIYAHLSAAIAVALAVRTFRNHSDGAARRLATVTAYCLDAVATSWLVHAV